MTSGQPSSDGYSLTTGGTRMPRQYAREPLSSDEGNRLIQACDTLRERQVILILLDTGLRVSELAQLTTQNILWQERRLAIHGKSGPYGKRSKRRVLPMTDRVRLLIEHHYTMQDSFGITTRTLQYLLGHDRITTTELYMNLSPEDAIREFQHKW